MDDIIYANYSKLLRANINLVCLSKDKNVNLLKFFEINDEDCKKYLRSTMIMIEDEILTTNYTDTTQFIEELALFDKGNEQNRFFSVEQHKNAKNLKLNFNGIYLSQADSKTICKLYNQAFAGYSLVRLLEFEYKFNAEDLANVLHYNNLFDL